MSLVGKGLTESFGLSQGANALQILSSCCVLRLDGLRPSSHAGHAAPPSAAHAVCDRSWKSKPSAAATTTTTTTTTTAAATTTATDASTTTVTATSTVTTTTTTTAAATATTATTTTVSAAASFDGSDARRHASRDGPNSATAAARQAEEADRAPSYGHARTTEASGDEAAASSRPPAADP